MRDKLQQAGSDLSQKMRRVVRRLIWLASILIATIPLMWIINITGYREWNFIPFFLGGLGILAITFRLDTMLLILGIGTLHGAVTEWSIREGISSGLIAWRKVTTGALSIFWVTAGLLAIHPWQESPKSFWLLVSAVLIAVSFLEYHEVKLRALKLVLVLGYVGAVGVYAFWNTVPGLWQGRFFDPITGEPLVMMEPDGSWIDYDRGPKDCLEGCYSPYTGNKLVPISIEAARKQNIWPVGDDNIQRDILRLRGGETKTVDIIGTVRIPIPVKHCLDISPQGKFLVTWDSLVSNAFVTPKISGKERLTVTALPANQCGHSDLQNILSNMIEARSSGQIIAPVSTYSVWLQIPRNKCIHWWTNEPEDNDIRTKYVNALGEEWHGDRQEEPAMAQAWKSNLTHRVHVFYETVTQLPDGKCPSF